MKTGGSVLVWVGLAVAIGSLFLPVSIATDGYTAGTGGRIVNLSMLQSQTLAFHGGIALFIAGIILLSAGAVLDALAAPAAAADADTDTAQDEVDDLPHVARWDDQRGEARVRRRES